MQADEKNKRSLNMRIVDLEEELKRSTDATNLLNDKLKIQEDRLNQAQSEKKIYDAKIS